MCPETLQSLCIIIGLVSEGDIDCVPTHSTTETTYWLRNDCTTKHTLWNIDILLSHETYMDQLIIIMPWAPLKKKKKQPGTIHL